MAVAKGEVDLALDMARSVAAIMAVDTLRGAAINLRVARDQAKLIYDSELERANEIYSNATLAAIDAYDRSIAGLMSQTVYDQEDDDE